MAIDYNSGINSIDVGAHDITYSGNQGPKSPEQERQMAFDDTPTFELQSLELLLDEFRMDNNGQDPTSIDDLRRFFYNKYGPKGIAKVEQAVQQSEQSQRMASADPILQEQYDQYVFDLQENNPGATPMTIEQFRQQAISGMAEGGIARLGYRGGQLVKNNSDGSRPGYQGWGPGAGSPGTTSSGGHRGGPPGGGDRDMTYTAPPAPYSPPTRSPQESQAAEAVVAAAQAQAAQVAQAQAQRDMQATIAEAERLEAQANATRPGSTNPLLEARGTTVEPYVNPWEETAVAGGINLTDVAPGTGHPFILGKETTIEEPVINPFEETGVAGGVSPYVDTPPEDPYKDRIMRIEEGIEPGYVEPLPPQLGGPSTKEMAEAYLATQPPPDDGGGGEGLGGEGITSVPIDTTAATTAAETGTDLAAVRDAAIAEAATKSGLPFEDYYVGGDPTAEQEKFMQEHQAAASMVGREAWPAAYGGRTPAAFGGIMDSETGRKGYFLGSVGKVFKKAAKTVKKLLKSPIGKAALLGGLGIMGAKGMQGASWKKFLPSLIGTKAIPGFPAGREQGTTGLLGKLLLKGGADKWSMANLSPMKSIGLMSMLPFLTQGKEDEQGWTGDFGPGIDPEAIRRKILAGNVDQAEFPFVQPHLLAAQGGRIGYQDGRSVRSIALNQLYGIAPKRKVAQEGGLMDLGGMEKDYRQEGGFVPIGGQERADDVPARLSKNEFVFTADAVRAAGGGDIDKGAEVMENVMENLEQGGQVSEESQGLEGARNMFATAQRLEGVL